MSKIQPNTPFRAQVPNGYDAHLNEWDPLLIPAMAIGAHYRYKDCCLTPRRWGALLRKMSFTPHRIGTLKGILSAHYATPLTFDEWCDLFEQLAIEHVATTQHPGP
jgi:hypothetical protein